MTISSILVLVSVVIAFIGTLASDAAADGSCETDSSALLQTSRLQRAVNVNSPEGKLNVNSPCWRGKMTMSEYKKCMASIPLDPIVRDCTLAMLAHGLEDTYAYAGLFLDSLNNSAVLNAGYDFKEHEIKLSSYNDSVWQDLRTATAAGTFIMDVAMLIAKLKDGHSWFNSYLSRDVWFIPPIIVRPELQNGQMAFRIEEANCELKGSIGKFVQTVNGLSAVEYFTEAAFAMGKGAKDASVAINQFLWDQNVRGILPPDGGQMNFVLTNGETFSSSWTVDFDIYDICSKEEIIRDQCHTDNSGFLAAYLSENRFFNKMAQGFIDIGLDLPCGLVSWSPTISMVVHASSAAVPISNSSNSSKDWPWSWHRWSLIRDSEGSRASTAPIKGDTERQEPGDELTDGNEGPVQDPIREEPIDDVPGPNPVVLSVQFFLRGDCFAVRLRDKVDICSLKIVRFVPVGQLQEFQKCAVAAVGLAEKYCNGDLLLDVLGHVQLIEYGEGSASGYWLNYFLFFNHPSKPYLTPLDICESTQYPKNTVMDQMVDTAQKGIPQLCDQADPTAFIKNVIQRMKKVRASFTDVYEGASVGLQHRTANMRGWKRSIRCLKELLKSHGGEAPKRDKRGKVDMTWVEFETGYNECWAVGDFDLSPFGMNSSGIYPPRNTSDPLDWEFYNQADVQVRGGKNRNLTSLSYDILSCPWHPRNPMRGDFNDPGKFFSPPTTALKNVRVLSDGTCGSTCSVVVSQQYLDGLATVITYGGLSGQPMDISSRNGGDLNWYLSDRYWFDEKRELKSILERSIWYPDVKPLVWPFMEFPPFDKVVLDLTDRAHMANALGPKALPREWYLLPAQYHLDYWTLKPLNRNPEFYRDLDQKSFDELTYLYNEANSKLPKPFIPKV